MLSIKYLHHGSKLLSIFQALVVHVRGVEEVECISNSEQIFRTKCAQETRGKSGRERGGEEVYIMQGAGPGISATDKVLL